MLKILLASPKRDRFQVLQTEMAALHPIEFSEARDGRLALESVRKHAVDLVIVDEDLGDMAGMELVRQLLGVNALVNTALVSTEPHDEFHEHSEGLGVLMQLPDACGKKEAGLLIESLGRMGLLTKQ